MASSSTAAAQGAQPQCLGEVVTCRLTQGGGQDFVRPEQRSDVRQLAHHVLAGPQDHSRTIAHGAAPRTRPHRHGSQCTDSLRNLSARWCCAVVLVVNTSETHHLPAFIESVSAERTFRSTDDGRQPGSSQLMPAARTARLRRYLATPWPLNICVRLPDRIRELLDDLGLAIG